MEKKKYHANAGSETAVECETDTRISLDIDFRSSRHNNMEEEDSSSTRDLHEIHNSYRIHRQHGVTLNCIQKYSTCLRNIVNCNSHLTIHFPESL